MAGNNVGNALSSSFEPLRSNNGSGAPRSASARATGQEASVLRQNGSDGKQPSGQK